MFMHVCMNISRNKYIKILLVWKICVPFIVFSAEAGVQAMTYIKKGLLVPDHVMTRLLLPRLVEMTKYSWLLDGMVVNPI